MKKVQLEVWTTFDKLCLISAITKLKTSFADQNWVTISRYTKQLYETVSSCIDYDKRNDDWFSAKQCAAQYEYLVKGSGARKKKRIDRNTDYSDIHEALLTAFTEEFCEELQQSLGDIKDEYSKTKKLIEDIDSDKVDDEKLEELITEMLDKEKATDIKSKLKSMLDEKNADCESNSKSLLQQTLMPSEPSTSGEQKTANVTTSPLLTSLLQSPSPLVRPSPSTSSPTISLLLHSSPPVSLTDSTLSKLLETPTSLPTTTTVTSLEASFIFRSGGIDPQQSSADMKVKNPPVGDEALGERTMKETDEYEKQDIFDDMSDIEQGVVESEVIIENESSPIKRLTPRRLDMEQVEDEEPEEEILETVEEIIERVEEAIIETVGENNLNELVLSEAIETVSISDDEIENINIEDNTYEVIVVGSQEVAEQSNNPIPDHSVIIEEPIINVDKTKENDNEDKLVISSTLPPINDEVENVDSISNKSVSSQNSELFKEDSSLKIGVDDEISSKACDIESENNSENLLEVSSGEKEEEGTLEAVIQEEKVVSSHNGTTDVTRRSEKFQIEERKSNVDGNTLFPNEQKSPALKSHDSIENIEHLDITKVSDDNDNSYVKCIGEIYIDNNNKDEINECKRDPVNLSVHEIISDKMATEELTISDEPKSEEEHLIEEIGMEVQTSTVQNQSEAGMENKNKLKVGQESEREAEFLYDKLEFSEIKTDLVNKGAGNEILNDGKKQLDSHKKGKTEECQQIIENNVNIFEAEKVESYSVKDSVNNEVIMDHITEESIDDEKNINDKEVLMVFIDEMVDESVNESEDVTSTLERNISKESILATEVQKQPNISNEDLEHDKNIDISLPFEGKQKQLRAKEVVRSVGEDIHNLVSSANKNEITSINLGVVDTVVTEPAVVVDTIISDAATKDVTDSIITINRDIANTVIPKPAIESVPPKTLVDTVVPKPATEANDVMESTVAATRDLVDTVHEAAVKSSATKALVSSGVSQQTFKLIAAKGVIDSIIIPTRALEDTTISEPAVEHIVSKVVAGPSADSVGTKALTDSIVTLTRDQVDTVIPEPISAKDPLDTIVPKPANVLVTTKDTMESVNTALGDLLDTDTPGTTVESNAFRAQVDSTVLDSAVEEIAIKPLMDSIVAPQRAVLDIPIPDPAVETIARKAPMVTIVPKQADEGVAAKVAVESIVTATGDLVDNVTLESTVKSNAQVDFAVLEPAVELVATKSVMDSIVSDTGDSVDKVIPEPTVESDATEAVLDTVIPEPAVEPNTMKALLDTVIPEQEVESNTLISLMDSIVSATRDLVDTVIPEPPVESNAKKALLDTVIPEQEVESNTLKSLMDSIVSATRDLVDTVIPEPAAESNAKKAMLDTVNPEQEVESNTLKSLMDSIVSATRDLVGTVVAEPTTIVLAATKDKVYFEEKIILTKTDKQKSSNKKIIINMEEVHQEHEETQESIERYSDKLDESDEDSDSKDKSDSNEETEDNSLLTTEDSKDGLDDSLKFSSLETLSNNSVDSPPESYYNDPKFAGLRTKEMELRSIMQKGFADLKNKVAELVQPSTSTDEHKSRSKKSEKRISSKENSKHEKNTKPRNKEKNSKENTVKLKNVPGKTSKEKVKERTIKDKPTKGRLSKDKLNDEKFIKIGRKAKHLSSVDSKPDSPSLSTTSSDEDRDYKSWKKSILLVYNRLASHKYASVFSKPITENEAPSYHQLILRPMDLSTIKRNIENGVIRTTVEFQRDMLLMVQNAIIYNKYDTPVYDMAKIMGEDMLAQMEVMVQALGDGVPLIGDTGDEKQITRARTSKSSNDTPQSKKRKNQDPDESRPKRNKLSASSS